MESTSVTSAQQPTPSGAPSADTSGYGPGQLQRIAARHPDCVSIARKCYYPFRTTRPAHFRCRICGVTGDEAVLMCVEVMDMLFCDGCLEPDGVDFISGMIQYMDWHCSNVLVWDEEFRTGAYRWWSKICFQIWVNLRHDDPSPKYGTVVGYHQFKRKFIRFHNHGCANLVWRYKKLARWGAKRGVPLDAHNPFFCE